LRAIELDPKNAKAYVLLGSVYQDQRKNADAVAAYQRFLELEPNGEGASEIRQIISQLK
jgi:cytochrome c-type biogenesis protein CcmH/NrfG